MTSLSESPCPRAEEVVRRIAEAMGDGRGQAFPALARRLDAGVAPFIA